MIPEERWRRAEPILDAALGLAPEDVSPYLDATCAGDPELRDDVESLLRACREAEERQPILTNPAAEWLAPLLDEDPTLDARSLEGEAIGPYRILERLASGGMGVVYLARDSRLDRRVALKLLPPWLADHETSKRRFAEEAKAASALDHPNIETVYDIGETDDGRLYMTMAYYAGETLEERIRRGPLPVGEAVSIARQIVGGLAAAHERGIVHRDVKPGNVMLLPDGSVKIVDFGIAKFGRGTITRPGATPGTVAYMSPEQTRGEDVDGRADLWSLGVALYEMLTGVRPFRQEAEAALIHAIRHDPVPPARELRPEVPEWLDDLVAGLLRKDPDDRPGDARSVAERLDAAGLEAPGVRVRASRAARRWVPSRLRRRTTIAGLLVALVGIGSWSLSRLADGSGGAGGAAGVGAGGADGPVRVAVLPFEIRGDDRFEYLEEGMVELLSTQLDGAGPLRSVDPRALLGFARGLDGGIGPDARGGIRAVDGRAVARRFGAALYVAGSVVEAGGRLRVRAGLYDAGGRLHAEVWTEADDESGLFTLVDHVARELIGSRYPGATRRLTRLAVATTASIPALKVYLDGERFLRDGQYDRALESFRLAVQRDSAFALAWYRLAVAGEWTLRPEIVEAAAERAVDLGSVLPEHDRLLVTAWRAYATGASGEAERIYRRVLDGYPDDVEAWIQLGEVLFHYGPLEGRPLASARPAFEQVLAFEPGHAGALLHLARIAAREGARAELSRLVERLLTAQPQSEIAVEVRALRAFVAGDAAARRAVVRELRGLDSDAVFAAIWTVAYARDPEAVARLAGLLTERARPADVRAAGHLLRASAELGRGKWRSAKAELAAAEALAPGWALELGALYVASGIAPATPTERDSVRSALRVADAVATPAPVGSTAFLTAHEGVHRRLRSYLSGLLEATSPDASPPVRADDSLPELRPEGPAWADTLAANLSRGLRAELRHRAGRDREALALLESAPTHSPYVLAAASPFHAAARERMLRARLLESLGRPDDALRFYTTLGDGSVYDLPFVAPAQLAAASLLRDMGDTVRAAERERRVGVLWREADPEVRRAAVTARGARAPGDAPSPRDRE